MQRARQLGSLDHWCDNFKIMGTANDKFTPEQRALFGTIAMTTIALWKSSDFVRGAYAGDINALHEHLVLNAMNSRWAWDQTYIVASMTLH